MNTHSLKLNVLLVLCGVLFATFLGACHSPMSTQNRPIVTKGPSFDQSFATVQSALKDRGYLIAEANKQTGHVRTEKRTSRDYWWVIDAQVSQDGAVEFRTSGSENIQKGEMINRIVFGRMEQVQRTFDKMMSQAQTLSR